MNIEQLRAGLEGGKLHPHPLLQHLAREGDEEGARFVAETGPEYLHGKERLTFRTLVRKLVPEALEAEESEMAARSERRRRQQTTALGDSLTAMNAATREGRQGPLPTGGGWSMPMDV
jgi:hypothetical protein